MLEINNFDKIIVANWKLNGSYAFIESYFEELELSYVKDSVCGIICPPSAYFHKFNLLNPNFFLGAQNSSLFDNGQYTGEISAKILKDNNCKFCIVGHSERRKIFKETDQDIMIKSENLINNSIIPIICIGETYEDKIANKTKDVLFNQVTNSLPENSSKESLIIAYEPIWAIGSGLTASLDEIDEIHGFLKKNIEKSIDFKIIYGGSVKSENSKSIVNLTNVDGVLVGGASLNPIEFSKILEL